MGRLILLVLFVVAAWYGWKHWDSLRAAPANEVVIENSTGHTLGRLRVSIGDTEYPAYDSVYAGKKVTQKFPLATQDGQFHLHWIVPGKMGEPEWSGGTVTAGPVRTRHRLEILPDNGVVWSSSVIPADEKK